MRHFVSLSFSMLLLLCAQSARAEGLDLVLVLDTTGSMGGLIERAKIELWGIVDQLAASRPTHDPGQAQGPPGTIRIGLVAYRDRGDQYVTRVFELTSDIDLAYATLTAFEAAGGGDGPESVNQGIYDAVHAMQWHPGTNRQRAIILAGDAPPHMDYEQDVPWTETVDAARRAGIAIHAIQCGSSNQTRAVWQAIATAGGGRYVALPSNPNAATTSPWDDQLAALNRELAGTLVPYGETQAREQRREAADRSARATGAAAAARASYLGRLGTATTDAEGDLVTKIGTGALEWKEVDPTHLPEALRAMTDAERRQHVEDQEGRRRGLLSEVAYYATKRDSYLQERRKTDSGAAFQREVLNAILKAR
jgi:Mg-chelatase subunit ChlD